MSPLPSWLPHYNLLISNAQCSHLNLYWWTVVIWGVFTSCLSDKREPEWCWDHSWCHIVFYSLPHMVPLLCGWLIDITVIFPVTMMRSGAMEILLMVADEYTHGLWLLADLRERFLPSAKTTKRFAHVVLAVCSLSALSGSFKRPPTLRG